MRVLVLVPVLAPVQLVLVVVSAQCGSLGPSTTGREEHQQLAAVIVVRLRHRNPQIATSGKTPSSAV
jgi:hypothetical protein